MSFAQCMYDTQEKTNMVRVLVVIFSLIISPVSAADQKHYFYSKAELIANGIPHAGCNIQNGVQIAAIAKMGASIRVGCLEPESFDGVTQGLASSGVVIESRGCEHTVLIRHTGTVMTVDGASHNRPDYIFLMPVNAMIYKIIAEDCAFM